MSMAEEIIALKELLNEAKCQEIKCQRVLDKAAYLCQVAAIEHTAAQQTVQQLADQIKKETNAHFLERVLGGLFKGA